MNNEQFPEEEQQREVTGENVSTGKKIVREIFEWVELFTLTIAIVLTVFNLVIRPTKVDGTSMNQTLQDKDVLLTTNFNYTPKDGDIVVIQSPDVMGGRAIVKRVIATGGEVLDIDFDNWKVTVNGKELDEDYVNYIEGVPMHSCNPTLGITFPYTVPEGKIFVMGDNRNGSSDSRWIGPVDQRAVFGHALFRLLPFGAFGGLD